MNSSTEVGVEDGCTRCLVGHEVAVLRMGVVPQGGGRCKAHGTRTGALRFSRLCRVPTAAFLCTGCRCGQIGSQSCRHGKGNPIVGLLLLLLLLSVPVGIGGMWVN